MDLLFIVGIARTGSKIYMTTLNRFSDADIVDEMHYLSPVFIRKDFVSVVRQEVGSLDSNDAVDRLVGHMYGKKFSGSFWELPEKEEWIRNKIGLIEPAFLKRRLVSGGRSSRDIFRTLLETHAEAAGKQRAGAKFPVNIASVGQLMEWYPDAKYIHLIRDPRAVFASMVKADERRSGRRAPGVRAAIYARRLVYLVYQYRLAAELHEKMHDRENYQLFRLEDTVSDPEAALRRLSAFAGMEYREEMLYPPKVNSSYKANAGESGIDKATLETWRKHVGTGTRLILNAALAGPMRTFGYSAI